MIKFRTPKCIIFMRFAAGKHLFLFGLNIDRKLSEKVSAN